jgi:hypothetical protein
LIVVFLVDYCLTHLCHCSTNAATNAATNATAATRRLPKPPLMLRRCCYNCCRCAYCATLVFISQRLSFAPAGCCVTYSHATFLPFNVLAPLDACHCLPFAQLVMCGFMLRHNLLTRNCLLMRRLVVVLHLVAPPSCLPRVVVASPLVKPPPPLNVLLPHLAPAPQPPICLLLRIPHPPPAGFSFECRAPADEWTKMGALLGFWLVGVL